MDVSIVDVNDNVPRFTRTWYLKTVQENAEIGSVIMNIRALDPDANRTLVYDLSPEAEGLVAINSQTGKMIRALWISKELDVRVRLSSFTAKMVMIFYVSHVKNTV